MARAMAGGANRERDDERSHGAPVVVISGSPVHDQAMAHEQLRTLDGLVAAVSRLAVAEPLIEAVWLVGSRARGGADPLSDIDLVLTAMEGSTQDLVAGLRGLVNEIASVALVHRATQNAPAGGEQLNVLYDVSPLPVLVDWSVWPPVRHRPGDAHVLFERDSSRFATRSTFEDLLSELPRGHPGTASDGSLAEFRLMMIPIVAKFAARGKFGDIAAMKHFMDVEAPDADSFTRTVAQLRRILADHCEGQPDLATRCVARYLWQLETLLGVGGAFASFSVSSPESLLSDGAASEYHEWPEPEGGRND